MNDGKVAAYVRAMPKVELHVHLEATMRPSTFVELARRYSVPLPVDGAEDLRQWLRHVGPERFFGVFSAMCMCLNTAEDFELIVYEHAAEMARQNVRYAEMHCNIAYHRMRGVDFDTVFEGLRHGRDRARADFSVDIGWILAVMRGTRLDASVREQAADYSVSAAIEGMEEGVVGIGLGGEEADGDVGPFSRHFDRARAAGLHVAPHAGEFAGPANVAAALDMLGAERIGHGVRAVEDAQLVGRLAASGVCLDMCPTSNLRLGACRSLDEHPLPFLRSKGVPVTLSTDDPQIFGIDVNSEIELAAAGMDLQLHDIDELQVDAIRHSFLPEARRHELEAEFLAAGARLRAI